MRALTARLSTFLYSASVYVSASGGGQIMKRRAAFSGRACIFFEGGHVRARGAVRGWHACVTGRGGGGA